MIDCGIGLPLASAENPLLDHCFCVKWVIVDDPVDSCFSTDCNRTTAPESDACLEIPVVVHLRVVSERSNVDGLFTGDIVRKS